MNEVQITILISILSAYIIILLFGAAHKIVIYFDPGDLVISLMPWFTLILTIVFMQVYQPEGTNIDFNALSAIQTYILYFGTAISFIFLVWTIILSIKYNRSFLMGLIVGIFKLVSVLLGVLILISQVSIMKDEKTKRKDFWFAILVFGAFWWLGKRLINGKIVYRDKGWELPK